MMKITHLILGLILIVSLNLISSSALCDEQIDGWAQTHVIAMLSDVDGQSDVAGLYNNHDMSVFEQLLGGRQSLINGSGITANAAYPLTDSDALTQQTLFGVNQKQADIDYGVSAEFYSSIGDDLTARAYGVQMPVGDLSRENGRIQTPDAYLDFYEFHARNQTSDVRWSFVGGVLDPKTLPEFTRKDFNELKLGALMYRTPISSNSFFDKEDRKWVDGRSPMKGADLLLDYTYSQDKHIHAEIFTGASEPSPLSDIERDAYGTRLSADIWRANVGVSYIYNEGLVPVSGLDEQQSIAGLDASFKLIPSVILYGCYVLTDYERSSVESHEDGAYVAGVKWVLNSQWEIKSQYQHLDENYDLMGIHKIELYPGNTQGVNTLVTYSPKKDMKFQGLLYYLTQNETHNLPGDTLFGDSFFASNINSDQGHISIAKIAAEVQPKSFLKLSGYVEYVGFDKESVLMSQSVDKDIANVYVKATWQVTPTCSAQAGYRHFFSSGQWQSMFFHSGQDIPELLLTYQWDKNRRLNLMYQHYFFDDAIGASAGRNDYEASQWILELKTHF